MQFWDNLKCINDRWNKAPGQNACVYIGRDAKFCRCVDGEDIYSLTLACVMCVEGAKKEGRSMRERGEKWFSWLWPPSLCGGFKILQFNFSSRQRKNILEGFDIL